jgi:hypothetical protein
VKIKNQIGLDFVIDRLVNPIENPVTGDEQARFLVDKYFKSK